jgi:hypothetical protein
MAHISMPYRSMSLEMWLSLVRRHEPNAAGASDSVHDESKSTLQIASRESVASWGFKNLDQFWMAPG